LCPVVLAAGGVLAGGPKPNSATAAKGVRDQFTVGDLQLVPAHQGSDSVFAATNLKLNDPIELWRAQLPFGCAAEASALETELRDTHRVPLFNDVEQQYIQRNTLKLFQWIATFLPHVHSQSTIQFEAKPSLTEILEEMRAVTLLRNKTGNLTLDPSYLELDSFEKSSISNRLTLMDSAVVDNVKELIHLVGAGQVRVETYSGGGGNYNDVQKACRTMQYSAFDRHSDFTLEAEIKDPAIGSDVKPQVMDATYFVVQGRFTIQNKGHANRTGQLSHTPYWVIKSTTDLPVEFNQIYQFRALHLACGYHLPYHSLIINSRRSILVRPFNVNEPRPLGFAWGDWVGKMPSKEEREKELAVVLRGRGYDVLEPYMQEPGQAERSADKRRVSIQRVNKAGML
jgi:hypothetical protein